MKRDARWFSDHYGPYLAIGLVALLVLVLAPSTTTRSGGPGLGTDTLASSGLNDGTGVPSVAGTGSVDSGDNVVAGATSGGSDIPVGTLPDGSAPAGTVTGGAAGDSGGAVNTGAVQGAGPAAPAPQKNAAQGAAPSSDRRLSAGGQITGEDCGRRDVLGPKANCKPVWKGANTGNDYRGVSKDTITIVFYNAKPIPFVDQALQGSGYADSQQEAEESRRVMEDWFNKNYQTYNRRVKIVFYNSQADANDSAANRADAVKIAKEVKAFAVVAVTLTQPDLIDELARQGVECFGCGLQLTNKYYRAHAPFVWGLLPDSDRTNALIAEYIAKKLGRTSKADFAGTGIQGQPRKYGIFFPRELYAEQADNLKARLAKNGIPVAQMVGYASDLNTAAQQATNAIQQMRNAGVTSVMCVCDPVAPVFLTKAATQQAYFPEWIQTGYYGQDLDLVARFYDQEQWRHNFGPAVIPTLDKPENGAPYKVWKKYHPTGRVPSTIGALWAPTTLFMSVVENAGARLNPATARDTMYQVIKVDYTNKFTPLVTYGPNDYGGIDDAAEFWWDPDSNGSDGQRGTYRGVNDYRRYDVGQWPTSPTQAFKKECLPRGSCGAKPGPNQT